MKKKSDISVFEKYAGEYDLMTNAAQREKYHSKEIAAINEKFNPGSVLDAGCATGLTSILFGQLGIPTVGMDRSRPMLKIANSKIAGAGLDVTFKYGQFEKIPKAMYGKFDLVVCLANSISGVHTSSELFSALSNFYSVLKPGGHFVLQLLNYANVEEHSLVPIRVTENDGLMYVRFLERKGKRFFVYAIRIDTNEAGPPMEIFRHEFDNFTAVEMVKSLRKVGFKSTRKYSTLYLDKPFIKSAKDLVLVSKK